MGQNIKSLRQLLFKVDTKGGEKDIYRLARSREKRSGDLGNIRYINHEDNKVLLKDNRLTKDGRATLRI